jgi:hypothetical protein
MVAKGLLSHILEDEALTRGLGDEEARVLVEWLVERAEDLEARADRGGAGAEIRRLCRRGRAISRFVRLWCHAGDWGAALQLACTERFPWPLPSTPIDACELMQTILDWETEIQGDDGVRPAERGGEAIGP